MSAQGDLNYLLQHDLINDFIPRIGKEPWQSVYAIDDKPPDRFAIFCALLEPKAVKRALANNAWDLRIGDGLPGFSQSRKGRRMITTYHRFGSTDGVCPLVIHRSFHGAWPDYLELCEEFRHFHNLAEDPQRKVLLDFDESGYEIEVARIAEHRVEINWSYLRQFLSATQLSLAVYFDSVRYSQIKLKEVAEGKQQLEHHDETSRYAMHIEECDFQEGYHSFSRLLGKVIIPPPPVEECGKWPFDETGKEPEVSFIIGVNADGTPREYTSNPDALSNYFGANPGAPHYLTPVYFRREVLQKYYAEPERYFVEDGYLRCQGLWGMRIDNSHRTHVVAFLGDLGRDLPNNERLYWRSYNVPPPRDAGISETCYRRSFLAQFSEPESVDLIFRGEYERLNRIWREKMGWPLLLDPKPEDEHIPKAIHVPVTDTQREFDEQILWLAKLLVDSLNEQELAKALAEKREGERGIQKLERFLKSKGFGRAEEVIQFLRDLQALRSSGAAHRKGENYEKILVKLELIGKRRPEMMRALLTQAVAVLRMLRGFVEQM